ncbi:MAG: hypothetical protein Q9190_006130 [Brigantiaea leucoxantha]
MRCKRIFIMPYKNILSSQTKGLESIEAVVQSTDIGVKRHCMALEDIKSPIQSLQNQTFLTQEQVGNIAITAANSQKAIENLHVEFGGKQEAAHEELQRMAKCFNDIPDSISTRVALLLGSYGLQMDQTMRETQAAHSQQIQALVGHTVL